ncbi:DnaD domain-containing protein [Salinicoccus siamensis]|uniref:DnaD domain-containing protein n=1 Tax=Salinicoccus siamensis TaxID=381830 RepID=A0ABV5Z4A1_9STAP
MTGWISLHRCIEDHWLFQEKRKFSKFEAWVDLLLMVNHKDNKVMCDNELIRVERGQRITSMRQLGERWGWSRTKVDGFLKLLESDGMILTEKDTKKTLLTVINYDVYQNGDIQKRHRKASEKIREGRAGYTQVTQGRTNNNDDKVNNALIMNNNDDNPYTSMTYDARVGKIFQAYEYFGFGAVTGALNAQVEEWLKRHSPEIIIEAMKETYDAGKKHHSHINGILSRFQADGLDTIEKVKADKRRFERDNLKRMQHSYQRKQREQPGEVAPSWLNDENRSKSGGATEPIKTAGEDPEIQKMITEFRSGG